MKKVKLGITLILVLILGSFVSVNVANAGKKTSEPYPSKNLCLDIITYAIDPETGQCYEFTNSCIPSGWIKSPSCEVL